MDTPIYSFKALDGLVELWPNTVTIKQKGLMSRLNKGFIGDKEISIHSIAAIQIKKPGLTDGYMQFVFSGSQDGKAGLFAAVKDNNSIMLQGGKRYKAALEFKAQFDSARARLLVPNAQVQSNQGMSRVDQLTKLAELKSQGILTNAEFEAEKSRILST